MVKNHKPLLTFNTAILLVCLILGYRYAGQASRLVGNNVVYITVAPDSHTSRIRLDAVRDTIMEFTEYNIAFEYRSGAVIRNNNHNKNVALSFVNSAYFSLSNYIFLHGGGWPQAFDGSNVIVLSENVAWELFGTINAVSAHVEIEGMFFEVSGVIRQESLDEPGFAWVAYNYHGSGVSEVSGIFVQGRDYGNMERMVMAMRVAGASGLRVTELRMIDLDQYAINLQVKFHLFVMFIAVSTALFFSVRLFHLLESGEANLRLSIVYGAAIVISALLCFFIWPIVDANLPITTDAFSLSAFINGMNNQYTFEGLGNLSHRHAKLHELNHISNFTLALGVLAFANIFVVGLVDTLNSHKQHTGSRRILA